MITSILPLFFFFLIPDFPGYLYNYSKKQIVNFFELKTYYVSTTWIFFLLFLSFCFEYSGLFHFSEYIYYKYNKVSCKLHLVGKPCILNLFNIFRLKDEKIILEIFLLASYHIIFNPILCFQYALYP